MPFSTLIGNEPAKSALKRMVEHHSVPHTLLFAGPDGVGKEQFALALATLLMGPTHAHKIHSGNHPDLHVYHPEGKAHLHPIEAMRSLIEEVGMPPFEAPVKVFIIHEAHQMLPSSSNALLKTLEEPAVGSYLILLSAQPDALLPTIISRCRKIPFFPIPDSLIADYCEKELNQSPEMARKTAFLAQGSLPKARAIASRSQDNAQALIHQLLIHGTSNFSHFLKICTQLESSYGLGKGESEEATEGEGQVDELFEEIAAWYRDAHLIAEGGDKRHLYHGETHEQLQSFAKRKLPPLERVFEAIDSSRFALQRHVKLRVALEEFFFKLARV